MKNMRLTNVKTRVRRIYTQLKSNSQLSKHSRFSTEDAQRVLNAYYPRKKPVFSQKNAIKPEVDLHIIVPVYNVERYLEECIDSIINQKTQFSYHVTLVNDGSTDASADILAQYVGKKNLTVIEKENGGLSSARNIALRNICGKYVMFVDSDDMLLENTAQTLLKIAFENDADIVEGSHQVFNSSGSGACYIHDDKTAKNSSKGLFGFSWGKVIKSGLLHDFCFPEDYLFEDTVMSALLHPPCKCVCTTSQIIYLYRENESGISKTSGATPRCIDTFWMMKYCLEERIRRNQVMDTSDLDKYLYALYRNWGRTYKMPIDVQESMFLLSCELIERYFAPQMQNYSGAYPKLLKTAQFRSFAAFETLAKNWWLM